MYLTTHNNCFLTHMDWKSSSISFLGQILWYRS